MRGPARNAAGTTNEEALGALVEILDGPPQRGKLYRVGMLQGDDGAKVKFIGEYLGLVYDLASGIAEVALAFAIRNPVPPANATNGTREMPLIVWPMDMWHLSRSQLGDLDVPMHFGIAREAALLTPPGRPPVQ